MPTRPTTLPQTFATDSTWTAPGDPWDGDVTKVDPTTYRASGFLPNLRLASSYLNYLLNQTGAWLEYFWEQQQGYYYNAANVNLSVAASTCRTWINPIGVITAQRVWTLADGNNDGDEVEFTNLDTANFIRISYLGLFGTASASTNLDLRSTSGDIKYLRMRWVDLGTDAGWSIILFVNA